MAKQEFLAHIAEDGRRQTVLEHLERTAKLCAAFAATFGAAEQGALSGGSHDIGKYSGGFQRRIMGNGPKLDHATAGAYECAQIQQIFAAFAVSGHHGGLPDGGGKGDHWEEGTFCARMNRARKGKLADYSEWKKELTLPSATLPEYLKNDPLAGMFFTRMLFSCLVDADYTDTEEFMNGRVRSLDGEVSVEQLWKRLEQHISGWFPPKNDLNNRRCAILKQCIAAGEKYAPGLFTLTVPTGGGKTVSSLAFALAQARTKGMRRVVYVIPYTSIIEQTADKFREILGPEAVLEHHSGVPVEIGENGELTSEAERLAWATETWDKPVIVTTAVRFFESLFSNKTSQCRKLHNLAQSVIVFDEAQMLPLSYLRPCVWAIAQLVQHYGASAVLCTATQPALDSLFREFAPDLIMKELCPMEAESWDAFRRVTFRQVGKLTWAALAEEMQAKERVLCVVNTRKAAREVFQHLEGDGNFHLSTRMYPAHRRAVLEEVCWRLKKTHLPCRVVSTSLIEAGVDVNFPAVFREEAGLDSILQAAGRCNREGCDSPEDSIVTIFKGEDKPPKLFETAIGAGQMAMSKYKDIASREAIHAYFHELLDLKGRESQDAQHILPLMEQEFFPFRTISERFHLIDNPTETVYIPIGEGAKLVTRLQNKERSRDLYRQLGQYGVSIYQQDLEALNRAGAIEQLEDGSFLLTDLSLYSKEAGLSIEVDSGKGLFI